MSHRSLSQLATRRPQRLGNPLFARLAVGNKQTATSNARDDARAANCFTHPSPKDPWGATATGPL